MQAGHGALPSGGSTEFSPLIRDASGGVDCLAHRFFVASDELNALSNGMESANLVAL
jgi:hypothetical protein